MSRNIIIRYLCILLAAGCLGNAGAERVPAEGDKIFPLSLGIDIGTINHVEADEKDIKAAMDLWVTTMSKNFIGTTCFYEGCEPIITDLKNGRLDMVTTNPLNFLRISEQTDSVLAYTYVTHGKKTHKYLLLARSDSGCAGLSDLKDKNLIIKDKDDIGLLIVNTLLLRHHHGEARRHFRTVREKAKYSQAILAVFFGQAHACVTTDIVFDAMAELNPQVGKRLRVVYASPEIVNNVSFFRKDYHEKKMEIIKNSACNMKKSVQGRQILMLFKVDDISALKDSDLNSLKTILSEYEKYKKTH